jgi:hypothetical protein
MLHGEGQTYSRSLVVFEEPDLRWVAGYDGV